MPKSSSLPNTRLRGASNSSFGGEVVPLGSVSIIDSGITLGRPLTGSGTIELPYLRVANVQDGFIDTTDIKMVRIFRAELERYRLRAGDVLMTEGGDFDKLGRGAVWDGAINPCLYQNHIFRVRCDSSVLLPEYLAAYSASLHGKQIFKSLSKQTTNLASINIRQLKAFPVPLPTLKQQRRMSEILSSAEDAIRLTERSITKVESVKRSLIQDLLAFGVDVSDQLRDPTMSSAFVDSELGRIPRDWRVDTIANIASKSHGSVVIGPFGSDLLANDYRNSGVPIVFVRDVQPDYFCWTSDVYVTHQKASALSAHKVRPGDLVITKMGLPPAIAAVYPDTLPPGIITADIIRLRPNADMVDPFWLSLAINSGATRHQISAITGGVTRPKITLRDFRKLLIALPPKREQRAISERVWGIAAEQALARAEREKLLMLKQGLTDDLLTGRVRVGAAT